jgi:hypothetical protein
MQRFCIDTAGVKAFGANGRARVISKFSFAAFQAQLHETVQRAVQ